MNRIEYFRVPAKGVKIPQFRERVYCYELYHQVRCILDDSFPYILHGELDKSGNPMFDRNYIPDFLVHNPGNNSYNLAVMEVKTAAVFSKFSRFRKDVEKILKFLQNSYFAGIILIYGDGDYGWSEKFHIRARTLIPDNQNIFVMWHHGPNESQEIKIKPKEF